MDEVKYFETINKWVKEHPIKTLNDKFFETFPKAPKTTYRTPDMCPSILGYKDIGCEMYDGDCADCWNQPYKEV